MTTINIIDNAETMTISNINTPIYRYKFTNEFTEQMFVFAKIHQYDDRKSFKEAWEIWSEEYDTLISEEVRRLTSLGYDGDILDKMFKSARYYFRKKQTQKKDSVPRKDYVCLNKPFLQIMDEHIKENINKQTDMCKPSEGFDEFCRLNTDLLKVEINTLYQNGITNTTEIKNKIKKTYKNRYFIIINK
jgi:hypothetical protein